MVPILKENRSPEAIIAAVSSKELYIITSFGSVLTGFDWVLGLLAKLESKPVKIWFYIRASGYD